MIGRLKGSVVDIGDTYLIIDVNGVGYVVSAPLSAIQQAHLDQEMTVHVHTVVREDSLTLYGFNNQSDKKLFELLITVSGIGPRLGLAILSTYNAPQIETAIATGQSTAFTAVSGIGKKNAERIILELKNKVTPSSLTADLSPAANNDELAQALTGLGYTGSEVAIATQKVDGQLPLNEQIKQALRLIGQES